jgi:hypothetical protein
MISLIKIEVAPDDSDSYIVLNNNITHIFSDLSSQPSVELPDHSLLKIIVKSQSDKLIGSVSIHSSLLSADIPQWLPLSPTSPQLKTLPEKTHPPRILVLFCTEHLPAVPEVTENSSNDICYSEECFLSIQDKNNSLRARVSELELTLLEKKWKHLNSLHEKFHVNLNLQENFSVDLEKAKARCEGLESLQNELETKANSLEVLYKQEKYQREYLEKQIVKITQDFEDLLQGESKKITEYKTEIANVTEKSKNLQEKLDFAFIRLRECEEERDEAKRTLMTLRNSSYSCEKCRGMHILQEKFEESEFQRKILKEKLEELLQVKFRSSQWNNEKCSILAEDFLKFKEFQIKASKKINDLEVQLESKIFDTAKRDKTNELLQEISLKDLQLADLQKGLQEKEKKNSETFQILQMKEAELKQSHLVAENIIKAKEGLEETVELLTEQIKLLSEKLAVAKQKNFELSQAEREMTVNKSKLTSDNADERFSEYIKNYGVEHHFERVAEGVYSFGSKKVSITLKNGYLVCRVGGGYMMIEEFLKLFVGHEAKNEHDEEPRRQSALLSPGNYSNRNLHRKLECESEGAQTERGFEYEYNYSNPINGLKENLENSPGRHKFSPTNRNRSFTPLRKGIDKRVFK